MKSPFNTSHFKEASYKRLYMWVRRYYRAFMHAKGYRIIRIGEENIPTGSGILCPNHRSGWDGLVIVWALQRRVSGMVGKQSLFKIWPLGWLLRLMDIMPVPHGRKADMGIAQKPMDPKVKEIITNKIFAKGRLLTIFPEGGVYHQPKIHALKAGAISMALKHDVPIIPAGIGGVNVSERRHNRNRTVVVVFGEQIHPAKWLADNGYMNFMHDEDLRRTAYSRFNESVLQPAMQKLYEDAMTRAYKAQVS